MKAVETTATVDAPRRLLLDEPLTSVTGGRVRVIVLLPEHNYDDSKTEEAAWLRAATAAHGPDFLDDPAEDIYSWDDGVPPDSTP